MKTKMLIPKIVGGMASISDGSGFAPAIIEYDYWSVSQLSIAKRYGGIVINGRKYKLLDSGEPANPGLCKPDLVREDWCSLYKKQRRALKEFIINGMSPSQVRKILKNKKDGE